MKNIPRAKFPRPQKEKQRVSVITVPRKNGKMAVTVVQKPRFKNLSDWIADQRAHGRMH